MALAATVLLNGLTLAALYFVVASGFSLIFGLMRTVNMAHGALYLVGAYVAYAVFEPLYDRDAWYAWYLAVPVGMAAAGLAGIALQGVLLGWMQGQELRQALVTIGVSIVVADQLLAQFGGTPRQFFAPDALFGTTPLPLVGRYPTFRLVQIAVALGVGIGLWWLLARTKLGLMVRAGVDDRAMLAACGVNVPLVSLAVFGLGAALAGLGGVIGATAQPLAQGVDGRFLLTSLVVVIVGGMGSVPGTAVGAVLVGLAEQVGQALFPTYAVILTFALMVAVLAVRPQGLLGRSA
ncbi:branched-chain amino acid ABC transporter permease [Methylobacterium isbiliense]|uniref:High-affinity branched-chain amino acid transport system permease protein LivH n=1 Tax=Methylobacterium isbiliense TaxID=315478 RepID=A0ABQ4SG87_9HYPH|nr:branched-chain amino acid ABC transporter permease [Methylobacterium isbiliense]MDN3622465.1 branched-chain amino acid ABC transporter permease [Methylobacterium isbiliense]GJE01510.1 High-affinity branched-chain amino acid transport system permease protein LivH [Methylobacterium isbiliense]